MTVDEDMKTLSMNASIHEAIRLLEESASKIVLLVDDEGRLKGTVTDGDIRRGILKRSSFDAKVSGIMNTNPVTAGPEASQATILSLMKRRQVWQVPIVGSDGRVVRLKTLERLAGPRHVENTIFLMAGGLGTRLMPITKDMPKPMVMVGSKPVLETILTNFVEQGFRRFVIAIRYKADSIKEYFGDGAYWNAEIEYVEEREPLGTAGALGLMRERPTSPFIVMNADILTNVNFGDLLDFHNRHKAAGTICVREFDFQVPYGVVRTDEHLFTGIDEKPIQKMLVNGGIYVLDPGAIDHLPEAAPFDMPTLFETMHRAENRVVAFPIREYWIDIGRLTDLERARLEFGEVFNSK